jgi:outer membrane protein TolC
MRMGLLALLGGMAIAFSAAAQPAPTPAAGAAEPLRGELPLSLQEAIALGVENNLDVAVVRHDPPVAGYEHMAAWGAYEPELFGEYLYESRATPVASALQASQTLDEREVTGQAGVRSLIPKLGWFVEVGYLGSSLETNSSIASLSPEYRATLQGRATLPLLRGFLWGEPWVQVKLTGIGEGIAFDEFRLQLMDTLRQIEGAYWALSANRQNLEVVEKSLETSKALLDQTQSQYEVGVVSRVEVTEAEAGVADRRLRVIRAENNYRAAQDRLINLVLGPNLTPGSDLEIVPTDPASEYVMFDTDVEASTARAFEFRPELAIAREAIEQSRINVRFAKNQFLPQLDVVAGYGYQGLAGATNDAPDLFGGTREDLAVQRRYSATDDDFFSAAGARSWSGGLVVTIPIGKVRGRANLARAKLELSRTKTQTLRQEQAIILEVRDAVRNLRSALEGIEAAEAGVTAAREQLRAEQIRLEYGESTPFEVLLREEDLVEAEQQLIVALQTYHDSVAALDRAQGTILADRNVVVEDALRFR